MVGNTLPGMRGTELGSGRYRHEIACGGSGASGRHGGVPASSKNRTRRRLREQLLERRIGDLNLRLDGTPVARLTRRLYDELEQAGLCFRPPVYLSDEWGCPDRVPIIGVPFYLADPQLMRLEDEFMEGVEAESDEEIMRFLRHEAGHALNYAYRLYDDAGVDRDVRTVPAALQR